MYLLFPHSSLVSKWIVASLSRLIFGCFESWINAFAQWLVDEIFQINVQKKPRNFDEAKEFWLMFIKKVIYLYCIFLTKGESINILGSGYDGSFFFHQCPWQNILDYQIPKKKRKRNHLFALKHILLYQAHPNIPISKCLYF